MIILDCDGVLYPKDQLSLYEMGRALRVYLKTLGFSDEELKIYRYQCKLQDRDGIFNFLLALCEVKKLNFSQVVEGYISSLNYDKVLYNPHVSAYLEALYNQQGVLVFCSNNHRLHIERILNRVTAGRYKHWVIQYLDILCFFYGNKFLSKPDPNLFLKLPEILNIALEDLTLVDDTLQNVEAASRLGMKTFLVGEIPALFVE